MNKNRTHKQTHTKNKKNKKHKKHVCYNGYGSNKSGNHTVKQFREVMRKHHLYDCLCKLCKETKDTQICSLSRKCTRRNKQKRKFTAKKWVKWSGSHYGKCL